MPHEHLHFVTGRLAERALREVVVGLADAVGFRYSVDVLPITVAALMTPEWIARHIDVPAETSRVLIPGYCEGDLKVVETAANKPVARGPRDLRQLPSFFNRDLPDEGFGTYDIQVVAEINHCPRLSIGDIVQTAKQLAADGADVIDVGCIPGETWSAVADAVKAIHDQGLRVSIDSMNRKEVESAVRAGAELVFSVNRANLEPAADWGCEVVAIPDDPKTHDGLDDTIDRLSADGVPFRIDPILEPIGFGFAASLGRYLEIRRRCPEAKMLMGVGNLTELTDVDSAGINTLLLGFCQELGIGSILTTQVIPWAQTSVRECDLARRLVHFAVTRGVLPKHLESRLITLRDPEVVAPTPEELAQLAAEIRDPNYRIFVADGKLHVVSAGLHLAGGDPFVVFDDLLRSGPDGEPPRNLDLGHAFYMGYELAKAATADTLGKQYCQDRPLDWGYLTREETTHRQ
jgi:dihydropteroate synthase-like protein